MPMPLFVNGSVLPEVFKNQTKIAEKSNQDKFHLNYLQEVLIEQQKLNTELTGSVSQFDSTLQQTRQEQYANYMELVSVLARHENLSEKVIENISEQMDSTSEIDDKLIKLEEMHEQFAKSFLSKELTSQAILDQLACQEAMIQDLNRKLLEYEDVTNALALQSKRQEELQDMIAKQADLQGIFHQTIMESLGKQDAVGESITDQLSEIKTSLSMKANAIIDKIENQYSKITQFFLSLILPNITEKKIIKGKTFKTKIKKEE
jgi:ssRNA-specific RNase YbeY (16S rRNA maturation enzyme)